jgi:hypothetical protein
LNGAINFTALSVVAMGFALYQCFDAYRWRNRRRLWIAMASVPPLGLVACVALWFAIEHPTFNFWATWVLGPDGNVTTWAEPAAKFVSATSPRIFDWDQISPTLEAASERLNRVAIGGGVLVLFTDPFIGSGFGQKAS